MGMFMALGMTVYYRMENKRRDAREGPGGGLAPGEAINVVEEHDLARGTFVSVPLLFVAGGLLCGWARADWIIFGDRIPICRLREQANEGV